jgi:hypothetical protein
MGCFGMEGKGPSGRIGCCTLSNYLKHFFIFEIRILRERRGFGQNLKTASKTVPNNNINFVSKQFSNKTIQAK